MKPPTRWSAHGFRGAPIDRVINSKFGENDPNDASGKWGMPNYFDRVTIRRDYYRESAGELLGVGSISVDKERFLATSRSTSLKYKRNRNLIDVMKSRHPIS